MIEKESGNNKANEKRSLVIRKGIIMYWITMFNIYVFGSVCCMHVMHSKIKCIPYTKTNIRLTDIIYEPFPDQPQH